jgi:hypothetical protein
MIILNKTYGFASGALAAPQANAMAAVIDPLMNGVGAPWIFYAIGAVLAIVLTACSHSGTCLRPRYVHPIGAQRSACRGWRHQLVRHDSHQGCRGQQGSGREGYTHREWIYRRWSFDGRCLSAVEVRRHRAFYC